MCKSSTKIVNDQNSLKMSQKTSIISEMKLLANFDFMSHDFNGFFAFIAFLGPRLRESSPDESQQTPTIIFYH